MPSTLLWCRGGVRSNRRALSSELELEFARSELAANAARTDARLLFREEEDVSPRRARPPGTSNTSKSVPANRRHRAAAAKDETEYGTSARESFARDSGGFVLAPFGPAARRAGPERAARSPSSSSRPSVGDLASRRCAVRARLASCEGDTEARPRPTRREGPSSKSSRRGFTLCVTSSPNTALRLFARALRSRPRPSSNRKPALTRNGAMIAKDDAIEADRAMRRRREGRGRGLPSERQMHACVRTKSGAAPPNTGTTRARGEVRALGR
mmetsp:Transcript_7930/g.33780  ORF Transcript_7930/g.33780 Transcript_7930/m.33780 type:complete len:270 (-) Transcript_7930:22-831(-)